MGSGANVGYLTVVSRWKEVISSGDAFVKSGPSALLNAVTYDWYQVRDLLIPSIALSLCSLPSYPQDKPTKSSKAVIAVS